MTRPPPDLRTFMCALLVASMSGGASAQASRPPKPPHPLVPALREIFRKENPRIERVAVLEMKSASPAGPHVLIGRGIRPDRRFEGDFRDELFGVFLLNREKSKIERVLDIIPTPRWMDYEVHVERITPTGATVSGKGSSYGDQPLRRHYEFTR